MARLPDETLRHIREFEAELRTVVDGGPPVLEVVNGALHELIPTESTMSYVMGPRGDGLRLEQSFIRGRLGRDTAQVFDRYLAGRRVGWTGYNPIRPEPEQRNVALNMDAIMQILGIHERGAVPVLRDLYPRFGLGSSDNLRVLVCEGPSLLAWVGYFREEPFNDLERRTLQRLVPTLQRRLRIERQLAGATGMRALFEAAFVAIAAPAFLTDTHGSLLEANPAGSVWIEREGRAGREALRAAAARGHDPRFEVTPIAASGAPKRCLVVLRPRIDESARLRATPAAARWSLTSRQAEVLALLVEGLTTRTIAASMGISERAVEQHLTVMFEKAQVENRAQLVAMVWRGP